MKKNMGKIDKLIRLIATVAFIWMYFTGVITGITGVVLIALSAVFLLTSAVGFCPLYFPFKISTCAKTDS